jgi:uncharacterized LabA/DUF88 family protein
MPNLSYTTQELSMLVQGFTEGEITQTVHSLAKGTVGPEGFPAEFYQKYWAIIKTDIINLINAFHKNELDLWRLNRASIILIPKKQGANKLEEFRPISVIPGIIKIISKLMAQRLQKAMSSLIDIHQTAFIPGRSLMKTFLVVRESIHFRNKNHIPSVALKIDFRKAFDTVSWEFLYKLLILRGFPQQWVQWIRNMLISSSSSININGYKGNHFYHMRGLRQGDPLSPLLFILITDTLQSLIQTANNTISTIQSVRNITLQFADDNPNYYGRTPHYINNNNGSPFQLRNN